MIPSVNRNSLAAIEPSKLRLIIGITVVMTAFSWFVAPSDSRLLVALVSGLVSLVAITLLLR